MMGTIEKTGRFFDAHSKRQHALEEAIAEVTLF